MERDGGGDTGLLYYNGSNWEYQDDIIVKEFFFLSPDDGWLVTLSDIYRWNGTNWTKTLTDYDVWFEDIYFTAPNDGWAVSSASAYGSAAHYYWDGTS